MSNKSDILLQAIDARKLNFICMHVCTKILTPTNTPIFTRQRVISKELRTVFLKYLLHIICNKVAMNLFQFCQERDLFPEDDNREEESQEEEAQSDEYHNPPNPESEFWDPAWIQSMPGIIYNHNQCSFVKASFANYIHFYMHIRTGKNSTGLKFVYRKNDYFLSYCANGKVKKCKTKREAGDHQVLEHVKREAQRRKRQLNKQHQRAKKKAKK